MALGYNDGGSLVTDLMALGSKSAGRKDAIVGMAIEISMLQLDTEYFSFPDSRQRLIDIFQR